MEWPVFQIENLLARSRGPNQCVSDFAHGGKPMPWVQPLSIQKIPNAIAVEDMP